MDERRFSVDRMAEKKKDVLADSAQLPMESLNLQTTRQEPSAPIGSPPSWQSDKEPRAPRAAFKPQDFKIGKLLGLGSYSKVAQATLIATGQEYALKVMDKGHIIRERKILQTKRERNILDRLGHPGVVRLCFTFQDQQSLYMGLELCPGGELFDQIKRRGKLPLESARFYAAEVVDCLEHIHSEGVIHRDLKPENLLFTADGHLKLGDFGSAIFVDEGAYITAPGDERKGSFVGTAEYVSPEMLNSKHVAASTDYWALGCLIFQMLTGVSTFKAASEYLCFQRILQRDIVWPPDMPNAAMDLIDGLLDMNPKTRLGSDPARLAALKAHPFFAGVDWSNVRGHRAPPLLPAPALEEEDDDGEKAFKSATGRGWQRTTGGTISTERPVPVLSAPAGAFRRLVLLDPHPHRNFQIRNAIADDGDWDCAHMGGTLESFKLPTAQSMLPPETSESSRDDLEIWERFLLPGERIAFTTLVKKHKGFSSKKRQLLLTNTPRLLYMDPVKMVLMGTIPWTSELSVRVESPCNFNIWTPGRTYVLQDLHGLAWQWKAEIEALQ
ncbi:3-phosphoinositide-dependent protein kinase [Klebsormidium nitens]|uniref:non-specific serine/threonine protein kinase n=1 Tax=Klebsormidium nitens TaxID=105231 RepID=A0A1Y1HTF3_KLENI|nr:3-phosphoinositide-dependent protein kinase [Klebsormidium nitens]|eukprot:GAQ81900.1 3-phosphoinositide-dependent protein kinase [Klebsormidium nitens]